MSGRGQNLGLLIPTAMILYGMYVSTESAPLLIESTKIVRTMSSSKTGGVPLDVKAILDPFDPQRRSLGDGEQTEPLSAATAETGLESVRVVYRAGPCRMIKWKGQFLRAGGGTADLKLIKVVDGTVHVCYEGKLYVIEGCGEQPLVGGVLLAGPSRAAVVGGAVLQVGSELSGIRVVDVTLDDVSLSIDGVAVVCEVNPRPTLVALREERS